MKALQVHAGPRALQAPARARAAAAATCASIPARGRRAEGPGAEPAGPVHLRRLAAPAATQPCTCWARRSAPGAWPRLPARRRRGAGAAGRRLHRASDYDHAPGKAPTPRHVSEVFGAQAAASASARRAPRCWRTALPAARVHQPRPAPAAARRARAAHAAGLPRRVRRQCAEPPRDGRLAGARGLLRPARPAAAAAARLPHATARRSTPHNLAPASWRAARSRSGWSRCTTSPARRAAPTGTAASPTTTCTWTTRRCGARAWCCTRTSRRSSRAGWTRR